MMTKSYSWFCPVCGSESRGMMEVVNYEPDCIEGSHCRDCRTFIPTDEWIIEVNEEEEAVNNGC
jgi:RNA polymerase subunit RPABC4/transcription elongation factor Spt4